MFLYFLCILATEYITIRNEASKPIDSTVAFKSVRDRFLYDKLVQYMQIYQITKEFNRIVEIVHDYTKQNGRTHKSKPSVAEIKLLLTTSILSNFGIGKLSFTLLDLAKEFDDDLLQHFEILGTYNWIDIEKSVKTSLRKYSRLDYVINKSMSFIVHAYTTLMFEIILFQIDHGRWLWQENDQFENSLSKIIGDVTNTLHMIFDKGTCEHTIYNYNLSDIFQTTIIFSDKIKELQRKNEHNICICIAYSYSEILDAFYSHSKEFYNPLKNPYTLMRTILENNPVFRSLHIIAQSLPIYNQRITGNVVIREITKYEFFYGGKGVLSENYTFDAWKKDAISLMGKFLSIEKLLQSLPYNNH